MSLWLFGSVHAWIVANRDHVEISENIPTVPLENHEGLDFWPPAQEVLDVIRNELSQFGIHGICVFGSYPQWRWWVYSDYDFTILCDSLPEDIHAREKYSPRIKEALRNSGFSEICAFNLYNTQDFVQSQMKKSWLPATMRKWYWILQDANGILNATLWNSSIEQIWPFMWQWVESEDPKRLVLLSARYKTVAMHLVDYPTIAPYYEYESERIAKITGIYTQNGIFPTRAEIEDLPIEKSTEHNLLQKEYLRTKDLWYMPWASEMHLDASQRLSSLWFYEDSLLHAYLSVRVWLLNLLWKQGIYPMDGEVTQIFLRDMMDVIDKDVLSDVRAICYKSEQVLGRCGYISFDLDSTGSGVFSREEDEPLLKKLISELGWLKKKFDNFYRTGVSTVIKNGLLVPNEQLEVISSGSSNPLFAQELGRATSKALSVIISDMDDRITRPLWIVRIANYLGVMESKIHTPRTENLVQHLFEKS